MSPTCGVATSAAGASAARWPDWRIWVASFAMMLCSWLSYVDRQILAVLSPAILRDTGLSAQSYTEVVSAFSLAYMIANPLWGSIPPLGWELGYFFWGWAADRFAGQQRPASMFFLLAVCATPLAAIPRTTSSAMVLLLLFWSMFITGGFQMLALRTGARAYPREQTALVGGTASGAWSAVAAVLLPVLGRWFDRQQFAAIFSLVAFMPLVGTALWFWLSRASDFGRRDAVQQVEQFFDSDRL